MQYLYALAARAAHTTRMALAGCLLALPLLLAACTTTPALVARPQPVAPLAHCLPYAPTALRVRPLGVAPAPRTQAPMPADTSARGMANIWADLRRRSYFLDAAADAPTARVAGNATQRLSARLAPATYTLAAAVPLPARSRPDQRPAAPRAAGRPAWQVGLTLRGIGRAGHLALRPAAVPTVAAATDTSVRYQHGAAFALEYTNTPAGVRQNYYLAQRPAGAGGPVRVELALTTTGLRPVAQADGQALAFVPAGGGAAVLRYDHLRAWDATGRVLPSRLRLHGRTALALEVDDTGAAYPLTIDPLASTASAVLVDPNTTSTADYFGFSVAGAGDVNGDGYADVIVGAPGAATTTNAAATNNGRAYLYLGSAAGLGTTPSTVLLDPNTNTATDFFGYSVAGAGDVNGDGYADVIVGAYGTSPASSAAYAGRVYLYLGSSTGLASTPSAILVDPNTTSDYFGSSVAGAGDVNGDGYADVIIGAYYAATLENTRSNGNGRAYLYLGSSAGLSNTPSAIILNPNTTSTVDFFGNSVAGAGDVNGDGYADVLIGAYRAALTTNAAATGNGRVYLYLGSSAGLSNTPSTVLTDPNTTSTGDAFGSSVAGAGDVNGDGYADVIVGAYGAATTTNAAATYNGRAYLYLGSAAGLVSTASATLLDPNTTNTGDYFGISVAGAGDVNGDGYADVLVAAYCAATAPNAAATGNGRVYLYLGSGTGLSNTPSAVLVDPNTTSTNDYFGSSVAGAGDVNGDGYADVIVGAPGAATTTNAAITNNGRAYLYLGSADALLTIPTTFRNDPNTTSTGDAFGSSVAGAGDVNGDGYADVIVGAYGAATTTNAAATYNGRAYLYLGSAAGLVSTASATLLDPNTTNTGDYFGISVAGAGDVNGDGYADVLVGAYCAATTTNAPAAYNGRAYLYLGSSTGLDSTPSLVLTNPNTTNTGDAFGISVAGAGDVNGDGYADVVVGAYKAATTTNAPATNNGRAYFYLGSSTGLANTPSAVLVDPNTTSTTDYFGFSVAGAGDVNGDGYADVIVGAYGAATTTNATATYNGRAYLYLGSAAGLPSTASATLLDPNTTNTGDYFGISVAGAGDVNGDGYADVIVGAYNAATTTNAVATSNGRAYLYLGSAAGLPSTASAVLVDPNTTNTGDYFGGRVAGAGDVNGDGYADVIVGAYGAAATTNAAANNNGRAYLYLGSAAGLVSTASATLLNPNVLNTSDFFGNSVAGAGDVNGDGYADVIIGAYYAATGNGKAYIYLGNQGAARPGGSLRLYNTNLSTPLTVANRPAAQFGLGLTTRSVLGRVRARLVWEVAANGQSFLHASPITNSVQYSGRGPWTDLTVSGTELKQLVSKAGHTTRVRARLEYASAALAVGSPAAGTGGVGSAARYGPWQYVVAQQQAQLNALPLPVELTAFTAALAAPAAVRLAWATASEKSSASFNVERSADGTAFGTIGTVAAAGSSSVPRRYELLDTRLPGGAALLYYRLRQVDTDGTFSYSPVRTVSLTGAAEGLALYPNPAHAGAATLTGALPGTRVTMFDALGRSVTTATADATGTAALALPAGLPAGVYVVRAGSKALRLTVE
jgi:hypothetical protein